MSGVEVNLASQFGEANEEVLQSILEVATAGDPKRSNFIKESADKKPQEDKWPYPVRMFLEEKFGDAASRLENAGYTVTTQSTGFGDRVIVNDGPGLTELN